MPNTRGVMDIINTAMQTDLFSKGGFQQSKWNTLAYVIPTAENDPEKKSVFHKAGDDIRSYRPVLTLSDGECIDLSLDDQYSMQVFHIQEKNGFDFAEDLEDDFGSPGTIISEIDTFQMIFLGNTQRLNNVREDIISAAMVDFPKELDPGQLIPLGLSSCVFDQVKVNDDEEEIFSLLWKGHDFPYIPNQFIFSISYKMKMTFAKKCFTLCS